MKQNFLYFLSFLFFPFLTHAQYKSRLSGQQWVDSVYKSLNNEQRIAQLMVIRAHSNLGADHVAKVAGDIKKYNVGALCFFQGGPVRQANLTNYYQSIAKTPLMVTIDGEYGLGMRLDSVIKFPYQLTLGAMQKDALVYEMGRAVGEQCKRLGVHVNYAPDVDVNNNPNNPVIGFRSFGEDKEKVAAMGIAYTKGMQDAGIMACAKHFPGHGDVAVDSHLDLPVINKTRSQLDALELYPFKKLIAAGVQSVMVAHLSIPSIDGRPNRPTSISYNAINGLLRNDLGFKGLTFTDALEMKGVAKYYPGGTIAVEALLAGNDMLCLPENVEQAIKAIKTAIKTGKLSWKDIEEKTRKVLWAKYNLGLNQLSPINTNNLVNDLNAATNNIRQQAARQSIALLKMINPDNFRNDFFQWPLKKKNRIAYVRFGNGGDNVLAQRLKADFNADMFTINYNEALSKGGMVVKAVQDGKYDVVLLGIHDINTRKGANNFGISANALSHWQTLNRDNALTMVFGNALSLPSFCLAKSLVLCHEDDAAFQNNAADWLRGDFAATGTLPVTMCAMPYGAGIKLDNKLSEYLLPAGDTRFARVDSMLADALKKKAFPGCVVLAAKDGQIVYHKAFGRFEFDSASQAVQLNSIYDLASVTKVSAVLPCIMKLYEERRIDIKKKISDYLPFLKHTNKANITLEEVLLHEGGMVPFITFYKETLQPDGTPRPDLYRTASEPGFTTMVARNLYLRNDWKDTIWKRIIESPVTPPGKKYVYSDNDFWILGRIVETVTGQALENYVRDSFYIPLNMQTTGYHPMERFPLNDIVPTEKETGFRNQLLQGTVHDEGAALGGGVAGHAGLFSSAYDLGKLWQMYLTGGELNGDKYYKWETLQYFSGYSSPISRRGLGFDKPEKKAPAEAGGYSAEAYPCHDASQQTFGHTGFTGTCVWVDPRYNILYIFLSNRVNPTRNNSAFAGLNIRGKVQDAIYEALGCR